MLPRDGEAVPFGADGPSDETRKLLDEEVRRIVEECYGTAQSLLRDNRDKLDSLAHALLQKETLEEEEAYAAAGVDHLVAEAEFRPQLTGSVSS